MTTKLNNFFLAKKLYSHFIIYVFMSVYLKDEEMFLVLLSISRDLGWSEMEVVISVFPFPLSKVNRWRYHQRWQQQEVELQLPAGRGMRRLHAGSKHNSSSRRREGGARVKLLGEFWRGKVFFCVCHSLCRVVTGRGSASVNYMSQQTFVLMSRSSHRQTSPVVQKRSLSLLAELIQSTKVGASPLQPLLLLLLWKL